MIDTMSRPDNYENDYKYNYIQPSNRILPTLRIPEREVEENRLIEMVFQKKEIAEVRGVPYEPLSAKELLHFSEVGLPDRVWKVIKKEIWPEWRPLSIEYFSSKDKSKDKEDPILKKINTVLHHAFFNERGKVTPKGKQYASGDKAECWKRKHSEKWKKIHNHYEKARWDKKKFDGLKPWQWRELVSSINIPTVGQKNTLKKIINTLINLLINPPGCGKIKKLESSNDNFIQAIPALHKWLVPLANTEIPQKVGVILGWDEAIKAVVTHQLTSVYSLRAPTIYIEPANWRNDVVQQEQAAMAEEVPYEPMSSLERVMCTENGLPDRVWKIIKKEIWPTWRSVELSFSQEDPIRKMLNTLCYHSLFNTNKNVTPAGEQYFEVAEAYQWQEQHKKKWQEIWGHYQEIRLENWSMKFQGITDEEWKQLLSVVNIPVSENDKNLKLILNNLVFSKTYPCTLKSVQEMTFTHNDFFQDTGDMLYKKWLPALSNSGILKKVSLILGWGNELEMIAMPPQQQQMSSFFSEKVYINNQQNDEDSPSCIIKRNIAFMQEVCEERGNSKEHYYEINALSKNEIAQNRTSSLVIDQKKREVKKQRKDEKKQIF